MNCPILCRKEQTHRQLVDKIRCVETNSKEWATEGTGDYTPENTG